MAAPARMRGDPARTCRPAPGRTDAAAASLIGWFSAATARGSHSHAMSSLALPVRAQPLGDGRTLASVAAAAFRNGRARRIADRRSRKRQRVPPQHAGEQMPRRRQRRAGQDGFGVRSRRERGSRARPGRERSRPRRSAPGTPASRGSSRTSRAGRCRRTRRCRDPGTRSRVRRAAASRRGRSPRTPRSASSAAALSPAKPPPMTTGARSSHGITGSGAGKDPRPRAEGDQRAPRTGDADDARRRRRSRPPRSVSGSRSRSPP